MKNKTIAIIPARGNSKRLPNKNTLLLDGIPLLVHSILYAQKNSKLIDAIYVSTDDAANKEIALRYDVTVIDRPDQISGDNEPTVSCLKHVLESINDEVENVVLLQPTNPFRPADLLKECFRKFTTSACDCLFTVSQNHQKFGKIVDDKFIPFNYKFGQRSQDLEPLYYENGLLYITKANAILNDKIITENAFPFVVNHIFATIDIDTQDDFYYAKFIVNTYIEKY